MGQEKRAAGKGSRDIGEPAGQMKQKHVIVTPQAKRDAFRSPKTGRVSPPHKKP